MTSRRTLWAVLLVTCMTLASSGVPAWSQMTPQQRTEVSDQMMRDIARNGARVVNSLQQQRVSQIVARLVSTTQRRDVVYRASVLDSKEVNAYALPDGRVVVTSELLRRLPFNDNAPLAFALAHEVSHVEKRHAERTLAQDNTARAILGVLTGRSDEWVRMLGALSRELVMSGHSRGMEGEADRGGLEMMRRAGYDPNGALVTLRVLQSLEGKGLRVFPTHPPASERYKKCVAWMHEQKVAVRESGGTQPAQRTSATRPRARAGFGSTPSGRAQARSSQETDRADDPRKWGDGGDMRIAPVSTPTR